MLIERCPRSGKKLSFEKAKNISDRYSKDLIIGCDQTLYFKKRILNKPVNYEESYRAT